MISFDRARFPPVPFALRALALAVSVGWMSCEAPSAGEVDDLFQSIGEANAGGKIFIGELERTDHWRVTDCVSGEDVGRISVLKDLLLGLYVGDINSSTKAAWEKLSRLEHLRQLTLRPDMPADALKQGWISPGGLPGLQKLKLPFRCSDEILKALAGVADLQSLTYYLEGDENESYKRTQEKTDASVAELRAFRGLRRLVMPVKGVGNASLAVIKELTKLEELDLIGSSVDASGIHQIAGLTELISLGLNDIDQEGVNALAKLPRLEQLHIGARRGRTLDLSGLKSLKTLTLATNRFSVSWGKPVRWPPNLQSLCMTGWDKDNANALNFLLPEQIPKTPETVLEHQFPKSLRSMRLRLWHGDPSACVWPPEIWTERRASDITWLETLPNLEELELAGLTLMDWKAIKGLVRLKKLALEGDFGQGGSAALKKIAELRHLQSLKINVEGQLTDTDTDAISEIKGLRDLELFADISHLTAAGLVSLWRFSALERLLLRLPDEPATKAANGALAGIGALRELRELSLVGFVTDAELKNLAELKKLQYLDLHRSRGFTNAGLAELLKALPSLNRVRNIYNP